MAESKPGREDAPNSSGASDALTQTHRSAQQSADQFAAFDQQVQQTAERLSPKAPMPSEAPTPSSPPQPGGSTARDAVQAMHADLSGKLDRVIELLEALVKGAQGDSGAVDE